MTRGRERERACARTPPNRTNPIWKWAFRDTVLKKFDKYLKNPYIKMCSCINRFVRKRTIVRVDRIVCDDKSKNKKNETKWKCAYLPKHYFTSILLDLAFSFVRAVVKSLIATRISLGLLVVHIVCDCGLCVYTQTLPTLFYEFLFFFFSSSSFFSFYFVSFLFFRFTVYFEVRAYGKLVSAHKCVCSSILIFGYVNSSVAFRQQEEEYLA